MKVKSTNVKSNGDKKVWTPQEIEEVLIYLLYLIDITLHLPDDDDFPRHAEHSLMLIRKILMGWQSGKVWYAVNRIGSA